MNVEEVLCANCSQLFNIKKCGQIYMCGDTYVCSKACSYNRYCELKNIDPGFTRPDTWPLSKSKKSTSLFNSELISKATKSPVSNINKYIFINPLQKGDYDDIYDNIFEEETTPLIDNIPHIIKKEKCQKESNEIIKNGINKFCNWHIVVGVPSLCVICIIVVSRF